MTSSPCPTPAARRARCRPVVQLETAVACSAPTYSANSFSNAATSGPCVIQPDRMTREAASASRWSITGLMIGIMLVEPVLVSFPPGDEAADTFLEADFGLEA